MTQQVCNGAAEQAWQVKLTGGGQTFVNAPTASAWTMTLAGDAGAGLPGLYQWGCHGRHEPSVARPGAGNGSSLASSYNAGLCLDVNGAAVTSGAGTIAWTCQGSANQTFGAVA